MSFRVLPVIPACTQYIRKMSQIREACKSESGLSRLSMDQIIRPQIQLCIRYPNVID
jgi:hypothetical protein